MAPRAKDPFRLEIRDKDLLGLLRAFNKMDEVAKKDIKEISAKIAVRNALEIIATAKTAPNPRQAQAIASTIDTYASSKDPSIKLYRKNKVTSSNTAAGYMFPGNEFGSKNYKQFPERSPRLARGNKGYWLYRTLKRRQPDILKEWLESYKLVRDAWIGRVT